MPETWSLRSKEEHRPGMFMNGVLMKKLGPSEEIAGNWRGLHNEELHNLCTSPKYY
jgi:hypothetical protein